MEGKSKKSYFENKILSRVNVYLREKMAGTFPSSVSATRVELSKDYAFAKIFWDTFGTEKDQISSLLEENTKKIRSHLASSLRVRKVPNIKFVYDSLYEDAQHIVDLIKGK